MKYLSIILVFALFSVFVGEADSRVAATSTSATAARAAPTASAARSSSTAATNTATNVAVFTAVMSVASSGASADEVEDTIENKMSEEEKEAQTMFVDEDRNELVVLEPSEELLEETSYKHIYRVAGGDQYYIEKPIEEEANTDNEKDTIHFTIFVILIAILTFATVLFALIV